MWEKFKRDFRERFLNFETAKGIYLMPAGLVVIYVTIFHLRFLIQTVGCLFGLYVFVEGARKTFVNRVKQQVKVEAMVEARVDATPAPVPPPADVSNA